MGLGPYGDPLLYDLLSCHPGFSGWPPIEPKTVARGLEGGHSDLTADVWRGALWPRMIRQGDVGEPSDAFWPVAPIAVINKNLSSRFFPVVTGGYFGGLSASWQLGKHSIMAS